MNTLTLPRQRRSPYKSPSTKELPIGTRNKCLNMLDGAADMFEGFARKLGVSEAHLLKSALAEYFQRRDTWLGLAFRVACRLSNEVATGIRSIFSPGSPDQKAEAFKAAIEAEKIERTQAKPNADALIESLVEPQKDGSFEPTK